MLGIGLFQLPDRGEAVRVSVCNIDDRLASYQCDVGGDGGIRRTCGELIMQGTRNPAVGLVDEYSVLESGFLGTRIGVYIVNADLETVRSPPLFRVCVAKHQADADKRQPLDDIPVHYYVLPMAQHLTAQAAYSRGKPSHLSV